METITARDGKDSCRKTVRYHIDRVPDGFEISAMDRCPVRVTLEPCCFRLESEEQIARYGLCDYRILLQWIANAVMRRWRSPKRVEDPAYRPKWLREMTAKALNARIHPLWLELTARADPQVLSVQRRMFGATFSSSRPLVLAEELYRHPHLVADLSRFSAAAIAAASIDWLSLHVPWVLDRYPYAAQRHRVYIGWRPSSAPEKPAELQANDPKNIQLWIELLGNWRALFSPTGESYTSLNKTLMNLPGGVTPGIMSTLHHIMLERPVLDRLELITIGTGAQCRRRHHDRVFAHARRPEIIQAMALVADARNRDLAQYVPGYAGSLLSPRRTSDIAFFTRYLSDYPELHNGRIVGLAQRAVRWHRNETAGQYRKTLASLGLDRPTTLPPIPLPKISEIQFLSTVGEVGDEAERMRHCVASYAQDAVLGLCYLFHIERGGEMATVEVDRLGRVIQATGPGNGQNIAASWGRETLAKWGSAFPPVPERADDPQHPGNGPAGAARAIALPF